MESSTRIGFALTPDAAVMAMQDALGDGQTHTGALEFILAIFAQPLEKVKISVF
jgi:hypothetical protein